ncbi:MAG: translocation/assembly module TamB domain-containing protein [Paracoccaceae bacterium]
MARLFILLVLALLLPPVARAQDEGDRGFITGLLEDSFSGAGRTVRIEGFAGALSSRATFDTLTIADEMGVWITLRDGAISWNRSALLSRRVEIEELTAGEIAMSRPPVRAAADGGTVFEATGFTLPELPVSVRIGRVRAARTDLGAPVLGQAVSFSLDGAVTLEAGEGTARLSIRRTDGREGSLELTGAYSNRTRDVALDLLVSEGADGVAASLLGVPGRPEMTLALSGSGKLEALVLDAALSSDGAKRLSGKVRLFETLTDNAPPDRHFAADFSGDIAPLVFPAYREFFGADIRLSVSGRRAGTGRFDLDRLDLRSRGAFVTGSLALGADSIPDRANLRIRLGLPGMTTLLPLPGEPTRVGRAELVFGFDASQSDAWTLAGDVTEFTRRGFSIASARVDGLGTIRRGSGARPLAGVNGRVTFGMSGFDSPDRSLAAAVGTEAKGVALFEWQEGGDLRLPSFEAKGLGLAVSGALAARMTADGPAVQGSLSAEVADLARFSLAAGRPLGGAARIAVDGSVLPLAGGFDLAGRVEGTGLSAGIDQLDRLLSGASTLALSAFRNGDGLEIRSLRATAGSFAANLTGTLKTGSASLAGDVEVGDLSVFGPGYGGSVSGRASFGQADGTNRVTLSGEGRDIGLGVPLADPLLAGMSRIDLAARQTDGRAPVIDRLDFVSRTLSVTAKPVGPGGEGPGQPSLEVSARLADLAVFAPGFPGPVIATGTVGAKGTGAVVDLRVSGPGRIGARLTGSVSSDGKKLDLAAKGSAQAAVLNGFIAPRNVDGAVDFDLRLRGPARLSSLSGSVSTQGARFVAPDRGIAIGGIGAAAEISAGQAEIRAKGQVEGGGSVTAGGRVTLAPSLPADLTVDLSGVRIRDPELFDTTASGSLRVRGSVAGSLAVAGTLSLGVTEVRLPSTGLGYAGFSGTVGHVNEPGPVKTTRARAGLDGGERAGGQGRPVALDIVVTAANRVFVRGRGLDAEFGGTLRVGGTTARVVPSGGFNLIRGRLDLLGKRFSVDEGQLLLQGAVVPTVRFVATTAADGVTASIVIDGPAAAPRVSFVSSPPLPEEEVVARLLFGRGLGTLSVFQAAQLATAVAALAGKGGEGVVGRLRSSFGVDDLDVTTDETGRFGVKLGKYLTEQVYTTVAIGADGKSAVSLNLDVPPGVTVRGSLASDGLSSVGVVLERDY